MGYIIFASTGYARLLVHNTQLAIRNRLGRERKTCHQIKMIPSFLFYLLMVSLRMLWVDKSYINFVQRKKYLTFAKLIATLRMNDANVIFIQIHCRWHKKETNLQQTANYQHHKGRTKKERHHNFSIFFVLYSIFHAPVSLTRCQWSGSGPSRSTCWIRSHGLEASG